MDEEIQERLDWPGPNHFGLTDEESETRRRGPGCGGGGGRRGGGGWRGGTSRRRRQQTAARFFNSVYTADFQVIPGNDKYPVP
jgi:hypothetical protein